MLSQSGAALNRFPGLELKAWALVKSGAISKGFNVSGVSVPPGGVGGLRLTFAAPVAGDYICDVVVNGPWLISQGGTTAYVDVFPIKTGDAGNYTGAANYFVAVYGV